MIKEFDQIGNLENIELLKKMMTKSALYFEDEN